MKYTVILAALTGYIAAAHLSSSMAVDKHHQAELIEEEPTYNHVQRHT